MTIKEYLKDDTLEGNVTVTEIIRGERPAIRTDRTWFHPQGGGQKADRGTIGGVSVHSVRHAEGGEVDHFVSSVDGLEVGGKYPFSVDAAWRELNRSYHSGGHLLAGVVEHMFPGVVAVNGHQWPGEARVEFEGPDLSRVSESLPQVQAAVDEAIKDRIPVGIVGDPFSDRHIGIGDFKMIPCGGTHVSNTSEIGRVALRSSKLKGSLLRIGYEVTSA